MSLNQNLLTTLNAFNTITDPSLFSRPDRDDIVKALDAILEAGPTDPRKFKKAIVDNHGFWSKQPYLNSMSATSSIDNNSFLDEAGTTVGNDKFDALNKVATLDRVLLTLKDADEAQLAAIIAEADDTKLRGLLFGSNGRSTFGKTRVTIPGWNPASNAIFNRNEIDAVKAESRRQLLIKKAENSNYNAITAFLTEVSKKQLSTIKQAARGLDPTAVASASHFTDNLTDKDIEAIIRPVIKRAVSLEIKDITSEKFTAPSNQFALLLNQNESDFLANFSRVIGMRTWITNLQNNNEDINDLRGELGARFLIETYSNAGPERLGDLEKIAAANTVDRLEANIPASEKGTSGFYLKKAITTSTLPAIRQAAAKGALLQKIYQCDDEAALDAIISAKNNTDLQQVLATQKALGYTDNPAFREAFTEKNIDLIAAEAHIRKKLNLVPTEAKAKADYLTKLETIITANFNTFASTYLNEFAPDEVHLHNVLSDMFHNQNNDNINKAREEALITYLQQKEFSPLEHAGLSGLINPKDANEVKNYLKTILGLPVGSSNLDSLIGNDINSGFIAQLRRYAAAENEIRVVKHSINLSATTPPGPSNYAMLLKKINEFDTANSLSGKVQAKEFPLKEKQKLRAHFVESLIRNLPKERIGFPPTTPGTTDKLTNIANAKNLKEFKEALTAIGVTEHDWVNPKTREQMQKAACTHLIELDLKQNLPLGNAGNKIHPKLIKLADELSLNQQRALLDKPKALLSLSQATTEEEVYRVLGGKAAEKEFADKKGVVKDLVKENEKLALLAEIPNSEVAKILAQLDPPLTDKEEIKQIANAILAGGKDYFKDTTPSNNYLTALTAIYNIIVPPPPHTTVPSLTSGPPTFDDFKGLFGINSSGQYTTQSTQQSIHAQQDANEYILTRYRGSTTEQDKVIYLAIAALNKKTTGTSIPAKLTAKQAQALCNVIKNNDTYDKFITKAKSAKFIGDDSVPGSLANRFDPPLDHQITPKHFSEIKIAARQASLLGTQSYSGELIKVDATHKQIEEQFSKTKLGGKVSSLFGGKASSLKRLAKANTLYWLNPAFQGASKENAKRMGAELRELSEYCDTMVTNLNDQLKQVQEQLKSLPSDTQINDIKIPPQSPSTHPTRISTEKAKEMKEAVNEKKKKLEALEKEIKKELAEYTNLQLMFKGNPEANPKKTPLVVRQGILATLKEAEEGKSSIFLRQYKGYSKDYPNEKRADHLNRGKAEATPSDDKKRTTLLTGRPFELEKERFMTVDMPKPGYFREYTVIYDKLDKDGNPVTQQGKQVQVKSTYMEEWGNLEGKTNSEGVTEYQPELKLTANMFPPEDPANNNHARVHYAMDMATRMLATFTTPPSAKNPIILDGPADEVQYLWTALMTVGKNDPNMRFDASAIIVDTPHFNPEKQLSWRSWSGFSSDSVFKKYFETHPSFKVLMQDIKSVDALKFGKKEQKAKKTAEQDTTKLVNFYKKEIGTQGIEKAKEKDDTIAPSAPARPS